MTMMKFATFQRLFEFEHV